MPNRTYAAVAIALIVIVAVALASYLYIGRAHPQNPTTTTSTQSVSVDKVNIRYSTENPYYVLNPTAYNALMAYRNGSLSVNASDYLVSPQNIWLHTGAPLPPNTVYNVPGAYGSNAPNASINTSALRYAESALPPLYTTTLYASSYGLTAAPGSVVSYSTPIITIYSNYSVSAISSSTPGFAILNISPSLSTAFRGNAEPTAFNVTIRLPTAGYSGPLNLTVNLTSR